MKIAVVAPSCTLKHEAAELVTALAASRADCELLIHPQCFLSDGHFDGSDEERLGALREVMEDESVDAVWFARGGYGSNRIAEAAVTDLSLTAMRKTYLGYSDAGFLLAGLHKAGCEVAHGPMPQDVLRDGGEAAVVRSLDWLLTRDGAGVEPSLSFPAQAYNLTVLSSLLGTAVEPDLKGYELLIEEVSEHHYRIDRLMFHITGSANVRGIVELRVGNISDIPENDPVWGSDEEDLVRDWCARAGIHYGGRAIIGHDAANRVVPFGRNSSRAPL
jgi:muramoyltetrapeptide carboxypeptidase